MGSAERLNGMPLKFGVRFQPWLGVESMAVSIPELRCLVSRRPGKESGCRGMV